MKQLIPVLAVGVLTLTGAAAADNMPASDAPASGLVWVPNDGDVIRFDVLRQGKPFGSHVVRFDVAPDGTLEAHTDVKLRAGLGPIQLYRYDLQATERWQDGKLVELNGQANSDGKKGSVMVRAEGDGLDIEGTAFDGTVPDTIIPASHWNIAETRTNTLLSSENGQLIDVSVTPLGRETLNVAGTEIETNKFLLDSDIDVTLWYDDAGRWLKLSFTARGQDIDYVLTEAY